MTKIVSRKSHDVISKMITSQTREQITGMISLLDDEGQVKKWKDFAALYDHRMQCISEKAQKNDTLYSLFVMILVQNRTVRLFLSPSLTANAVALENLRYIQSVYEDIMKHLHREMLDELRAQILDFTTLQVAAKIAQTCLTTNSRFERDIISQLLTRKRRAEDNEEKRERKAAKSRDDHLQFPPSRGVGSIVSLNMHYGFIRHDDGAYKNIFFHENALEPEKFQSLKIGTKVSYELDDGAGDKKAKTSAGFVRILDAGEHLETDEVGKDVRPAHDEAHSETHDDGEETREDYDE